MSAFFSFFSRVCTILTHCEDDDNPTENSQDRRERHHQKNERKNNNKNLEMFIIASKWANAHFVCCHCGNPFQRKWQRTKRRTVETNAKKQLSFWVHFNLYSMKWHFIVCHFNFCFVPLHDVRPFNSYCNDTELSCQMGNRNATTKVPSDSFSLWKNH